jgi:hypothetical protein
MPSGRSRLMRLNSFYSFYFPPIRRGSIPHLYLNKLNSRPEFSEYFLCKQCVCTQKAGFRMAWNFGEQFSGRSSSLARHPPAPRCPYLPPRRPYIMTNTLTLSCPSYADSLTGTHPHDRQATLVVLFRDLEYC